MYEITFSGMMMDVGFLVPPKGLGYSYLVSESSNEVVVQLIYVIEDCEAWVKKDATKILQFLAERSAN